MMVLDRSSLNVINGCKKTLECIGTPVAWETSVWLDFEALID